MSGVEAVAVLGLISSIVTIVDATKKVYNAATDPKGLPEAFHEVADRLPLVESTLNSAKQNIQPGKTDENLCKGVKNIVEGCEKKARKLEELFQKAIPAEGASDLKRYVTAVKVWGTGNKVENLMKEILEGVQLLACEHGMKSATKDQQEQIIRAITEVSAVSPSIPEHELQETGFTNTNFGHGTQNNYNARGEYVAQGGGRQYISSGAMSFGSMNFHAGIQHFSVPLGSQEEETNACLRTLFLTDPRGDREELITTKGPRVDGTCEWIKDHNVYNLWLRSQSQLLWLSGGPGKGKTMLSIFLAEELEKAARLSGNKPFLQYFCDNKDEKRNTAIAILRGLIHQLLQSCSSLFDHILPIFRQQREALFSFETLWRIFASMVCDPVLETTYCVLDGLDECDETSLEMLLGKFAALLSAKTDDSSICHLNLLVVSRDRPDFIPKKLSSFPHISLDPDVHTEVSRDIHRFIKTKVKELSTDEDYSEELCAHVEKVFINRAEGTFLWIGVAAHALKKYKATEVEKTLDLLHPGLNALYARILLQIDSHRRETAARILRWVVMAVRPLTLLELSTAIETTVKPSKVPLSPDARIRDQISYCGDFLVLKEDSVGLVHQSAKDYLLRSIRDPNPELEVFRVNEEAANHEIAKRCLEYLQSGALETVDAFETYHTRSSGRRSPVRTSTFLLYATLYWHEHANLARSDDIFDLSQPFFHDESRTRALWLEKYCDLDSTNSCWNMKMLSPRSFSLLHLASSFNILTLAEKLMPTKSRIKSWVGKWKRPSTLEKVDSTRKTALLWAADRGHVAIVRLLLEKGANIEARSENQMTALLWAADRGHVAIVQLLLEKGANIEARNENQMTALIIASFSHEAIVRLLIEHRADISAKDRLGRTALSAAVSYGNEPIVRMLLKEGVDIETKNTDGLSPLMEAAEFRHGAILQLILERGPDIEMKNSALFWAARSGQPVTAGLLLGRGADINATDEDGETALMKAAIFRLKQEIDKDSGVQPYSPWNRGRKAPDDGIIQLLHERGAGIDAKDTHGETALMKMAGSDTNANKAQKAMIQLLLEMGADVNAHNIYGETALIKAAKCSYGSKKAVIQLLLDKGANVRVATSNGWTALMKAVRRGYKDVVQLLLEKGAEIDATDKDGETALMKAAEYGYKRGEAVVQVLLEHGAKVGAVDRNGTTALMRAQRKGHEGVVRLLTTG